MNDAEDIADAILWVGSDEASYMTGEIIPVDGGQSITNSLFQEWEKEIVRLSLICIL